MERVRASIVGSGMAQAIGTFASALAAREVPLSEAEPHLRALLARAGDASELAKLPARLTAAWARVGAPRERGPAGAGGATPNPRQALAADLAAYLAPLVEVGDVQAAHIAHETITRLLDDLPRGGGRIVAPPRLVRR